MKVTKLSYLIGYIFFTDFLIINIQGASKFFSLEKRVYLWLFCFHFNNEILI